MVSFALLLHLSGTLWLCEKWQPKPWKIPFPFLSSFHHYPNLGVLDCKTSTKVLGHWLFSPLMTSRGDHSDEWHLLPWRTEERLLSSGWTETHSPFLESQGKKALGKRVFRVGLGMGTIRKTVPLWLVWLSGMSAGLWTKGSRVQLPIRAHTWVVGQVPSRGCTRGKHTLMFLSLSFSFPSPLSKNK